MLLHHVPKKTKQICFCQNCVKFPPILISFGREMANDPNICEVHSFSTLPNLHHHLTVLNANVPNCYITPNVNFTFFTDEKVFTVAAPTNSQNDRFYVRSGTRKKDVDENRLLRTRPTFSKSVMVSVGVSKLGCTAIHFVEPGVKVNGEYYRNNLLGHKLLPDMCR